MNKELYGLEEKILSSTLYSSVSAEMPGCHIRNTLIYPFDAGVLEFNKTRVKFNVSSKPELNEAKVWALEITHPNYKKKDKIVEYLRGRGVKVSGPFMDLLDTHISAEDVSTKDYFIKMKTEKLDSLFDKVKGVEISEEFQQIIELIKEADENIPEAHSLFSKIKQLFHK